MYDMVILCRYRHHLYYFVIYIYISYLNIHSPWLINPGYWQMLSIVFSPTAQRCVGDPRYTSRYPSHRDLNLEKRVVLENPPLDTGGFLGFLFSEEVKNTPNPTAIYISYTYYIYIYDYMYMHIYIIYAQNRYSCGLLHWFIIVVPCIMLPIVFCGTQIIIR